MKKYEKTVSQTVNGQSGDATDKRRSQRKNKESLTNNQNFIWKLERGISMKIKTLYALIVALFALIAITGIVISQQDKFDKWAEECDAAKGRACSYHEVEVYARNH